MHAPRIILICKFPYSFSLTLSNLEWTASFFSLSLLSVYKDSFQISRGTPEKFEPSVTGKIRNKTMMVTLTLLFIVLETLAGEARGWGAGGKKKNLITEGRGKFSLSGHKTRKNTVVFSCI